MAIRLLGGLGALAILPVHLALFGAPTWLETLGYAWFLLPLAIVWDLSRNGAYERAHILSVVTFAFMVGLIASLTGGGTSFALPWLAVIPFEAAFYASKRTTVFATALAGFTAAVIAVGDALQLFSATSALPNAAISPLLFSAFSATLYSAFIALSGSVNKANENTNPRETRNRVIAENTRELVTSHGRNGAVTFVSPAAEQLLGVSPVQLMGHSFFDRVHVADRPLFLTAIAETAATGQPMTVEYRLLYGPLGNAQHSPKPPSFIWVETHCRAASSEPNGRQVIAATNDISQRKTNEIAVEQARIETQSAKEAKGRFLATVSHELRTPLNAIIGFSEMLAREDTLAIDADCRRDYVRLIRESGEHLLAVVNGILDASQIESGNFALKTAPLAIGELLENCRDMMALRAEQAGVSLSLELASALPEIVADKRALRQIVLNLLSNAIKFTDRGGKISVAGRVERNEFVLIVTDSGIGIAEENLKCLGNPFFQVHSTHNRPYEGTGLGLSVVKGIVELHGGCIKIESSEGKGTRVSVRLPLEGKNSEPAMLHPPIESFPAKIEKLEPERMKRRARI